MLFVQVKCIVQCVVPSVLGAVVLRNVNLATGSTLVFADRLVVCIHTVTAIAIVQVEQCLEYQTFNRCQLQIGIAEEAVPHYIVLENSLGLIQQGITVCLIE